MERQELIKKIEELPADRLAALETFVESMARGEGDLDKQQLHEALADYALKHAGSDADLDTELERASVEQLRGSPS